MNDRWYFRNHDKIAYSCMGIYGVVHLAWVIWAFSGTASFDLFDTMWLFGVGAPVVGLSVLVQSQGAFAERFSLLANLLCLATIVACFCLVWFIIVMASAAV